MSTVEEHIARLQAMSPRAGGWMTSQFREAAAIFCGAHLDEIEAAWRGRQQGVLVPPSSIPADSDSYISPDDPEGRLVGYSSSSDDSDTAVPRPDHIAETFNEFGTPVSMFRCFHCQTIFTVCPVVEPEKHDQWIGCMAEGCASYDEARDGDKLFEAAKVQRVGDRSCIALVATTAPSDTQPGTQPGLPGEVKQSPANQEQDQ